jgi:hypothetical protein
MERIVTLREVRKRRTGGLHYRPTALLRLSREGSCGGPSAGVVRSEGSKETGANRRREWSSSRNSASIVRIGGSPFCSAADCNPIRRIASMADLTRGRGRSGVWTGGVHCSPEVQLKLLSSLIHFHLANRSHLAHHELAEGCRGELLQGVREREGGGHLDLQSRMV